MKLIDTREPFEYASGHAEGAINIPSTEFMSGKMPKALEGVDKDEQLIVYCRSGQRANTCSMILKSLGFINITNGINKDRAVKIAESLEE